MTGKCLYSRNHCRRSLIELIRTPKLVLLAPARRLAAGLAIRFVLQTTRSVFTFNVARLRLR